VRIDRHIWDVRISRDGRTLLVRTPRRALLVDPSRLPDEASAVRCAATGEDAFLAPDGRLFAVWVSEPFRETSRLGRVHFLRAADCAHVSTAAALVSTPRAAAFSPDDSTLMIVGSEGRGSTLYGFRVADGAVTAGPLSFGQVEADGVAFSHDGARLAVVNGDGHTRVYRAPDLAPLTTYDFNRPGHQVSGRAVAFAPDGRVFTALIPYGRGAMASWGALEVARDGEAPVSLGQSLGMPSDVWFSLDGRFVGTHRGQYPTQQTEGFSVVDRSRVFTHMGWRVAWSGDGERVAIVDAGDLTLWGERGARLVGAMSATPGGVRSFSGAGALLREGWAEGAPSLAWVERIMRHRIAHWDGWLALTRGWLATPDGRYTLRITNAGLTATPRGERGPGRVIETMERMAYCANLPALSPDGTLIAVGLKNGDVAVHALTDGALVRTLTGGGVTGDVYRTFWSTDGRSLTAVTAEAARTWRVPEGDLLGAIRPPGADTNTEWDVSADGTTCAVTQRGARDTIAIYHLPTDAVIRTVAASHPIALSRDGRVLATAANPDRLDLWDVASGRHLRRLHQSAGDGMAFSPDGALLFVRSNSTEGSVAWGVPRTP